MKISLGTMKIALFFLVSGAMHAETIDVKIASIATAPAQERVALMNALKLEIAQMNEQDRELAFSQLKINRGNVQNSTVRQIMQNRMQQMNTQQGSTFSSPNLQNFQNNHSMLGNRR